jgi:hypothetical protein
MSLESALKFRRHERFKVLVMLQVLLFVMVYGGNPFSNVVEAETCDLVFPPSPHVSQVKVFPPFFNRQDRSHRFSGCAALI